MHSDNFVASVAFGCLRFAPEIWTRDQRLATSGFGPLARAGGRRFAPRPQVKESMSQKVLPRVAGLSRRSLGEDGSLVQKTVSRKGPTCHSSAVQENPESASQNPLCASSAGLSSARVGRGNESLTSCHGR
jgi:hypothetical protein